MVGPTIGSGPGMGILLKVPRWAISAGHMASGVRIQGNYQFSPAAA